jgi:uncharacterized membrane-anchored protein
LINIPPLFMQYPPSFRALFALSLGFIGLVASARGAEEAPDAQFAELKQIAQSLQYRQGQTVLKGGLATVNVSDDFRFLDAKDAETVLTKVWGNPPGGRALGMLIPADKTPFDEDGWAVVISYEESGFVKDDEAAKLDYTKLLKEMQESTRESNKQRAKAGYPAIELVNWATQPHYDRSEHKIYWAKQLRFADSPSDTVNYCVRALGRRGVLELNAVAGMDQLPEVRKATPAILAMVNFQEGHRYADFNAGTDKVASYGIAALITGGVLAKTGLLKGLLGMVLAFKKVFVLAGVGLVVFLKKLLFGKQADSIERA